MTASAALARLARNGLWRDPEDPGAREWLAEEAGRLGTSVAQLQQLRWRREASLFALWVAIRRQSGASVAWYAESCVLVLGACRAAPGDQLLGHVLRLDDRV